MITEQLKKTIAIIHSKNFDYKTAIVGSEPHLYLVVNRVNFLTAKLWLEKRNKTVNGKAGFVELPKEKPNWLVMVKTFRRDEDKRIQPLTNPIKQ